MDISGSYHRFQYKAMAVTGRMSLIRKLPLVAAIYEQAAVRVSYAFVTMRVLSFFRRAGFFREALSFRFFGGIGDSSSSLKVFFPCASRSEFASSISSFA